MTAEEIKILLIKKKLTIASVARRIRRTRSWTSQALYGHVSAGPTRRAIAQVLGIKETQLPRKAA